MEIDMEQRKERFERLDVADEAKTQRLKQYRIQLQKLEKRYIGFLNRLQEVQRLLNKEGQ